MGRGGGGQEEIEGLIMLWVVEKMVVTVVGWCPLTNGGRGWWRRLRSKCARRLEVEDAGVLGEDGSNGVEIK